MRPVSTITSPAVPLLVDNIDTDTIIPSREMKSTGKTGLADGLFAPWRYSDADARIADPSFVLNQPGAIGTRLLLGGANFGCGSSREHAVWALAEYGIEAIIAPSFAPIFKNNCIRNGLLPIALPIDVVRALAWHMVIIDLAAQAVTANGESWHFDIGTEEKAMLIEGLDAIDLTLKHADAIAAWQAADRAARPWVYLNPPQSMIGAANYFPPHLQNGEGDHAKHGGGVKKLPPKTNAAVARARALRRDMTPPENRLWAQLRARPEGLKFRRQHPAGPFTLDFYCAAAKLCVEVDGIAHDMSDRPLRDAQRDAVLDEFGIKTLRIPARAIGDNLDDVMTHILTEASARLPLHRPADGPPPHLANGEANQ